MGRTPFRPVTLRLQLSMDLPLADFLGDELEYFSICQKKFLTLPNGDHKRAPQIMSIAAPFSIARGHAGENSCWNRDTVATYDGFVAFNDFRYRFFSHLSAEFNFSMYYQCLA